MQGINRVHFLCLELQFQFFLICIILLFMNYFHFIDDWYMYTANKQDSIIYSSGVSSKLRSPSPKALTKNPS